MGRFSRAWPALLWGVVSSPAVASGFSLPDQSAEAAALANAWVARADGPAANWYNPAALTRVPGIQVQIGASLFGATGSTELRSGDPAWGLDPAAPSNLESDGESVAAPHLYFSQAIGRRWAWGVGVNRPFGFAREWSERPVTFSSEKVEFSTLALDVNGAWAINEAWSVGAGLAYVAADLDTFSRELAVNLDNDPSTIEATGRSDVTASGEDVGFDLAVLYATRGFSAAIVYRSGLSPTLDGDLRFSDFGPAQDLFPDSRAEVSLELPSELVGGVAWGAADTWQFELDVSWTQWSSFDSLTVDALDESPPLVADTRFRQDWDDTIGYHAGASWQFAEGHEARFGLAQEPGAVPDDTRRPAIPDADRFAVSAGYGFSGAAWSVDAYVNAQFFDEATASGDPGEGVLDGRYQTSAFSLGATLTRRF